MASPGRRTKIIGNRIHGSWSRWDHVRRRIDVGRRRHGSIVLHRSRDRVCPFDAKLLMRLGLGRQRVHSLPRRGIDLGRLAQHHRQHVMRGGHLGQMHVRLQTDPLEVGDAIRRQHVVEILRHRVRIEANARADHLRGAEPQAAHRVFRAMDQVVSKFARLDFLGKLFAVRWLENLVHVCQQSSEC